MENNIYKIYQVIDFFVTKYDYLTLLIGNQNKANEVWLCNFNNPNYQLIRISVTSLNDTENEIDRINNIVTEAEKHGKKDAIVLDIHISKDTVNGDEIFDTICLDTNYYEGTNLDDKFPGLKEVVHEVSDTEGDIKQHLASINQSIKTRRNKLFKKQLALNYFSKDNIATSIISAICLLMYIFSYILSKHYDNSVALIFLGADYKIFTLGLKQFWRLLSCAFLHGSLLHLFCNLISFFYIGSTVEKTLGKVKYLVLLFVGILISSLTHGVLSENSLSIGLSGGIYCLFTYFIMVFAIEKHLSIQQLMPTIFLNICLNFMSNVAWQAHLGGALCGILFFYVYKDNKIDYKIASLICLLFVGMFYKYTNDYAIKPYYGLTDMQVVELYDEIGFENYADTIEENLYKIYLSEE